MKHIFHLPVVAALALAGIVYAESGICAENEGRVCVREAVEAPKADSELIQQVAGLIHEGIRCMEGVTETLRGVEDRAGAEEAAKKVFEYTVIYRKMKSQAEALSPFISDQEEIRDALEAEMVKRGVDVDRLRLFVSKELKPVYDKLTSMEPPFFGSEALMRDVMKFVDVAGIGYELDYVVYDDEDDDAGYTEEQLQLANAAYEKLIVAYAAWAESLQGVHDKETADAAAEVQKKWNEVSGAIQKEAFMGGWLDPLSEAVQNDPREREVWKVIKREIRRLNTMDPPCYGSEALQRMLRCSDVGM